MSNQHYLNTFIGPIIDILEENARPMSAEEICVELLRSDYRNLNVASCARLLRTAAAARRVSEAPISMGEPRYVAVKRLFPESLHPMDQPTRPVASVWELALGNRMPWGHTEPKAPPDHHEKPTPKEDEKERPSASVV